jgi:PKD repeat protein
MITKTDDHAPEQLLQHALPLAAGPLQPQRRRLLFSGISVYITTKAETMRVLVTFLLVLLTCMHGYAQQAPCASQVHYDELMRTNSQFREREHEANLRIKEYIDRHLKKAGQNGNDADRIFTNPTFVIPVVVHVLHTGQPVGSGTNISYNQIRSQIDALNAAFARAYGTAAYPNGQNHPAYAVNTGIQFCLARIPAGPPGGWTNANEPGVMRYNAGQALSNPGFDQPAAAAMFNFTHPNSSFFPVGRYLNIWLVNSIGGGASILGYATFPLNNQFAPLDGMVMRADCFGDNSVGGNAFSLNSNSTQGKIAAHEAGHYLNLLHIFNDGCAGMNAAGSATDACDLNGDRICDIAPATTQGFNCNSPIPNTCNETYNTGTTPNDMVEDYMSYAQDLCMTTFTAGQRNRMQATLNTLRTALWTQDNLVSTGVAGDTNQCVPGILLATINRPANICTNQPVQYTTNTNPGNTATSWSWQFQGGTPATSNQQTPPPVTYANQGTFTVTLTVTNAQGTTLTNINTVFVSTCQLNPCKLSQAHWYFGRGAAINFNSGLPVPNNTAILPTPRINTSEAATTVSDANNGNLIYYAAPGEGPRNAAHGLFANSPLAGNNSASQMLSVPFPGHPGRYYVFTPSLQDAAGGPLNVAIINTAGNGIVDTQFTATPHNTNTTNRVAECVTGVPHCNGRDYWIIVRGLNPDRRFYVYLLSPHGLTNRTLTTTAPDVYPASGTFNFTTSAAAQQLKAAPDTRHLALTSFTQSCAVYDFNNETGVVSNENIVPVPNASGMAANSFSPNSQFIYTADGNGIISRINVATSAVTTAGQVAGRSFTKMQLGPNDRIYIGTLNGGEILTSIDNPDNAGATVITNNAVDFSTISANIDLRLSIPNFIDTCPLPLTQPECFVSPLNCSTFVFSVSDCWDMYELRWSFGDGSPSAAGNNVIHSYTQPGTYTVRVFFTVPLTGEVFFICTQTVTVIDLTQSITGPDTVCANAAPPPIYSVPTIPGATYNWQVVNGAILGPNNGSSIMVNWPTVGMGQVIVSLSFRDCRISDTLKVTIINCDTMPCACGAWAHTRWSYLRKQGDAYQRVNADFRCGDTLSPGTVADSIYPFRFSYNCADTSCRPSYVISSNLPASAYTTTTISGVLQINYRGNYKNCGLNYFRVTPICGGDTCEPCIVYFRQNCNPCAEIIRDTVYCDPRNGPTYDFCVQNNSNFTAYEIKVKIPANINPVNIVAPAGATYNGSVNGYYSFLYPAGLLPQQSLCGFRFSIAQPYTAGQQVCLGVAIHKETRPPYITCCEDTLYKRCFRIPDCRVLCGEIVRDTVVCTRVGPSYSFCVTNLSNFTAYLIKIKIPAGVNPTSITAPAGAVYTGNSGGYYSFNYAAGLPPGATLCTFSFILAQPYYAGQQICLGLALHQESRPPFITCCEDSTYQKCFTVPDCPDPCIDVERPSITCRQTPKGYEYAFNFSIVNRGLLEVDSLELQYINPVTGTVTDWCNWRLIPAIQQNGNGGVYSCTFPFSPQPGSLHCFRVIGYDMHVLGGVWCIKDSCVSEMVCVRVPDCGRGGDGDILPRVISGKKAAPADVEETLKYRLQPNPASRQVTIACVNAADCLQQVTLSSASGKQIASYRLTRQPSFTMNISGLPSGLYIITINNETSLKLIKE